MSLASARATTSARVMELHSAPLWYIPIAALSPNERID
jgi:hypothetical protein